MTESETVLVVDDNRAVADPYAAFLREEYTVGTAYSGREALDPRVVMLTAVDPDFDIVEMAFDAYVVKPVERADVTGVVAEMCERAGYDDEFRRFLSLASKKAALEREKDESTLAESEEYAHVEHRLGTLREELGIDTGEVEGIFDGAVPDIDDSGHRPPIAGE